MLAAASGERAGVTTLVENGAEIEAKEKTFGQTPLMFAASNNRVDAIKALVKAGAERQGDVEGEQRRQSERAEQEFLRRGVGSGNQAGGNGTGRTDRSCAGGAPVHRCRRGAAAVVAAARWFGGGARPASIVRTSTTN
jgi:hypothetical protein